LDWPNQVKQLQTNWIGRTEVLELRLQFSSIQLSTTHSPSTLKELEESLPVYVSSPTHLLGAAYIGISFDHPLIDSKMIPPEFTQQVSDTAKQIRDCVLHPLEKAKLGAFTGLHMMHPIHKTKIPVYVAGHVPSGFGGGAKLCAPGFDGEDRAFAEKHAILFERKTDVFDESGRLLLLRRDLDLENVGLVNGVKLKDAERALTTYVAKQKLGGKTTYVSLCVFV
jgi:leucyl-tRNA synthetase